MEGKSTFVAQNGYGFEEWLFQTDFVKDGYQYGYLQQFSKKMPGHKFDVCLFTIDGDKRRMIVGQILDLEWVSDEDACKILASDSGNEWLNRMEQDCKEINIEFDRSNNTGNSVINVRFKPGNLQRFEPRMIDFPKWNKQWARYIPYRGDLSEGLYESLVTPRESPGFGSEYRSEIKIERNTLESSCFIDPLHKKIHNKIKDYLDTKYGVNYSLEKDRVDVYAEYNGLAYLFEVKTKSEMMECLREALGQILEYYWTKYRDKPCQLVIVGGDSDSENVKAHEYLKHLNESILKISIHYVPFRKNSTGEIELGDGLEKLFAKQL
ncbi:MAG: hypothetical protein H3C47_01005 [Candidatus Cloacimonetes bacterium]|nr:hypothetical protein [Candidatus Cloacimonadota bacterium]